jgi:DNA-binding NarL/FixJ family response regulator
MDERPIRVLCVDDNALVGQVVKSTLKRAGGFQWLGHLSDAGHLVEKARRDCPDIILLDIYMPGKDPVNAMKELAEACPHAKVVMFSGYVSNHLIDRAIEAGAWGYISKHDENLVPAIRRVAHGEFVMGPEVQAQYCRR